MRYIFMGASRNCVPPFKSLLSMGYEPSRVFTLSREAKESSGMHPSYFADLKGLCEEHGIRLHEISSLGDGEVGAVEEDRPDLIVALGWPVFIPERVLEVPPLGVIGIHPSPLPERRGGAPLNWAIIDGLSETYASLYYLSKKIDAGDLIDRERIPIGPSDDVSMVLNRLGDASARLMERNIPLIERGKAPRVPQDHSMATYTRRRKPGDGMIIWSETSLQIYNKVRALTIPFPGAFSRIKGEKVFIWKAALVRGVPLSPRTAPGEIMEIKGGKDGWVLVATGDYCIRLLEMGKGGWERLPAGDLALDMGLEVGDRFEIFY